MPNHIHGIITIVVGAPLAGARNETGDARNKTGGDGRVRATARVAPTTVGDIVGTYLDTPGQEPETRDRRFRQSIP